MTKKYISKNLYKVCELAYSRAEIDLEGNITCCCRFNCNDYIFGNINKKSFPDIWNGLKAKKFRKSMLDGNFKYCRTDLCDAQIIEVNEDSTIANYPKTVELGISTQCNVRCVMCRDSKDKVLTDEEGDKYFYDKMLPKYLEALKHVDNLVLNSWGEALCDIHCKKLLVEAIKINPKLKIHLLTNGILCNEKHLKDFGIYDNIDMISVSIHAATKETYDKIVRFGNFEKVKKNVEWIAEQTNLGKFKRIFLNFVVSDYNYKEMIDFAKWVKSLNTNAKSQFWEFRIEVPALEFSKNYEKHAVFLPEHPEYENLIEILKNPIFKEKNCYVSDFLLNLLSNK